MNPHRRWKSALTLAVLPVTQALAATPPPIVTTGTRIQLGLESLFSMSGPPLALDFAPGDTANRMFVAGQSGQVRVYKDNALLATPFFSATTGGLTLSGGSEKGLLGMAFHPNYNASVGTPGRGKFYTYTSERNLDSDSDGDLDVATPDYMHPELGATGGDHDSVFREWTVVPGSDVIDYSAGSREIWRIRQPQANHNGGAIRFGPDNNLYIALGDGGSGNDHSGGVNNSSDGHTNVTGNAQDITNPYGKVVRINPLDPDAAGPLKYSVPASNPFVGVTGMDEVYAYGLRNPFRMMFDRDTGTLYAGDVGQGAREEVHIITNGGNYGWAYKEGTLDNPTRPIPGGFTSIAPIAEYAHSEGAQAVIGGTVYRGDNFPELDGLYAFGELDINNGSNDGRLFYMSATGGVITQFDYILNAPSERLYSIGEDKNGELYAMFANGAVFRMLGRQWFTNGGGTWGSGANWLAGVPNSVGASANFLARLITPASSPATINLDGSRTVGFLRFNNTTTNGVNPNSYVIAPGTGGSLILDNGASSALIHVLNGTHTITAPVSIASNTDLNIAPGAAINLTAATALSSGRLLTAKGGGVATLLRLDAPSASLAVTDNTTLHLTSPFTASRVASVSVTSATLDLTVGRLVTQSPIGSHTGSAYTGITGLIESGRNGGAWNGPGIITSQSDALTGYTSVAIATATETGRVGLNFAGVTLAASDVLVMYTYAGDADLSGFVDIDDYGLIDLNASTGGTLTGWYNGDFDYNGFQDVDDYGIIDFVVSIQGPPFLLGSAMDPTAGFDLSTVPEPTTVSLLTATTALLLHRRRSGTAGRGAPTATR